MKLPPVYDASAYESDIYALWEQSGVFTADPRSKKPHYSISMPPPNETGTLHIGHALFLALQDTLARHARSKGMDVLWLPGTDHAALATNAIIEKMLTEEGTDKHQLGREEFLGRTREYVGNSRDTINKQIRAMGASADWSRSRYTLDSALNRCVNEVFVKMYNDSLIYRGHRIVNWDPNLETNVSDDEVEYSEEKAKLYTFKYGPFEISTARPETKFGDKYVVMHPKDKRYLKYKHGDTFETEWINGKITAAIIKDESVDPEFGTGVMTITPWHSQIDFEIAQRHKLDREQIIDLKGNLLPIAGEFAGMPIAKARPEIVEKMRQKGLLISIDENYVHNIALNSRGKGIIEPQIRLQWFVDVNKPAVDWKGSKLSLKQVMQSVIRDKDIDIIPSRYEKVYFHWIDNLRDWCISRQIWWGHRIPVWYRTDNSGNSETFVGVLPPKDESEGWHEWEQDPDTLDTWFSSALWTWSTLIDPKLAEDYDISLDQLLAQSIDFQTYHPTNVLETGWDILFFWVARMILATTYVTGEVPFKTVYLHGLVRTETGKKMSKSDPDSIIDPLSIIPEYGTDALRLALIQGMTAGNDQRIGVSKIITNRNFCNKLWNIARFIEGAAPKQTDSKETAASSIADHWIVKRLTMAQKQIIKAHDNYLFSEAYAVLYHFLWDDLADWYIETSKVEVNKPLLNYILENVLILSHPLAPFVSETIWQTLSGDNTSVLASQTYGQIIGYDKQKAADFDQLKQIISEIRFVLSSLQEKQVTLYFEDSPLVSDNADTLIKLANIKDVKPAKNGKGIRLTRSKTGIWVDVDIDKAKNYASTLSQKQDDQLKVIKNLETRLDNKNYLAQAPLEIVDQTKDQLIKAKEMLDTIASEVKLFSEL
ncbi:MAG TPA: valine--tRNA ligase [Candidatus Saccharimonadales bacterium]